MKYIIVILFSLLSLSANAGESDIILALLKQDLNNMIKVKSKKEIWYCPNNTCVMYKIRKNHSDFLSFVYLHICHEVKQITKISVEGSRIKNKTAHYCPSTSKPLHCILKNMKEKLDIKVGFGRFDEGYFCYGYTEKENICLKILR